MITNDKQLLLDYLDNNSLDSLYRLVFDVNGDSLRKIVCKLLKTTDSSKIDECLIDFYDDLTKPTQSGEKKLRTFDFEQDLTPYLKQAIRSYVTDGFRIKQKKDDLEERTEDWSNIKLDDNQEEDYSDCYYSLLNALYIDTTISVRDQYILLTFLLSKVGNPDLTELKIIRDIAKQLGISESTVKKARQRSVDKLKSKMRLKF